MTPLQRPADAGCGGAKISRAGKKISCAGKFPPTRGKYFAEAFRI